MRLWSSGLIFFSKALGRVGGFAKDEQGGLLVQGVILSTLLLGVAGLSVDFGRVYNMRVQMQSYADHIALAAAAELDLRDGAVERARRVVSGFTNGAGDAERLLVKETQFAADVDRFSVQPLRFLTDLPDDPEPGSAAYPIGDLAPFYTESSSEAVYVAVVVEPATVGFSFLGLLSLFADDSTATTTNAVAVATLEQEICNFPPLMICNPWENDPAGFPSDDEMRGVQILAKTQGPGAAWAPGNFGFLDTVNGAGDPTCNGAAGSAARIRCVFGLTQPNTACVGTTVNTAPGESISVYKGMNVRFDMWDPPLNSFRNNPLMAPAPNTIKGLVPQSAGQCAQGKHDLAIESVPLPRDPCFATGMCDFGRIGDGVQRTQLDDYWNQNHGGASPPVALPPEIDTRHGVYQFEIDVENDRRAVGSSFLDTLGPSGTSPEVGTGSCSNTPYENLDRERRTLTMAVINCTAEGVSGAANGVNVVRFLDMFMTEPATTPGNSGNSGNDDNGADLWLEVIGAIEPGGDQDKLHEFPVLVR